MMERAALQGLCASFVCAVLLHAPALPAQRFWNRARNPTLTRLSQPSLTAVSALDGARLRVLCESSATTRRICAELPPLTEVQTLAQAELIAKELLAAAPDNVPALSILAELRTLERDWSGAAALLERAVALPTVGSSEAVLLSRLAQAYTMLDRPAETIPVYQRILALPQRPEARASSLCNLGETWDDLRELDRAILAYQACIAWDSSRALGWWGYAVSADHDGRSNEAQTAVREALTLDPMLQDIQGPGIFYFPTYKVFYYLGLAYEGRFETALAREAWTQWLAAAPADSPWRARVEAHMRALPPSPPAQVQAPSTP